MRQYVGEVEPNVGFMQQLAQYDLELLQSNEWGQLLNISFLFHLNQKFKSNQIGNVIKWQN